MSERPFMQLYTDGFIGETMMLSAAEVGAYIMLLMAAWNADGRRLPADPVRLAHTTHLSLEAWSEVWPALTPYFEITDSEIVPKAFDKWRRAHNRIYGRTPLSLSVRLAVMERDGAVCHYCATAEGPFHIDHVKPVALGGTDDLENLVVACKHCNLSKGAKTVEEWRL